MSALTSLLVRDGVVPVRKIEEALQRQVISGGDVETVLLEMNAVPENVLSAYRAAVFELPPATREDVASVTLDTVSLVPKDVAVEHRIVPLRVEGRVLHVAAHEPLTREQEERVGFLLGFDLAVHIVCEVRIAAGLAQHYGAELTPRMVRLVERVRTRDSGPVPEVGAHGIAQLAGHGAELPDKQAAPESTPYAGVVRSGSFLLTPAEPEEPEPSATKRPSEAPGALRRHRGPMTIEAAERYLKRASDRDEILQVLFAYSQQFFDYTALFVVHDDRLDGLEAHGVGAPTHEVRAMSLPLDVPSGFAEARRTRAPLVRRLDQTEIDRDAAIGMRRPACPPAFMMPVAIRGRVVVMLYGDRNGEEFDIGAVMELVKLGPRVVEAFEQLILRKKRAGYHDEAPAENGAARSSLKAAARALDTESKAHRASSDSGAWRPGPRSVPPFAIPEGDATNDTWGSVRGAPQPLNLPPAEPLPRVADDRSPQAILGIPRRAPPPPRSAELLLSGSAGDAFGDDDEDVPELLFGEEEEDDGVVIEVGEPASSSKSDGADPDEEEEDEDEDQEEEDDPEDGEDAEASEAPASEPTPRSQPPRARPAGGAYIVHPEAVDVVRAPRRSDRPKPASEPPRDARREAESDDAPRTEVVRVPDRIQSERPRRPTPGLDAETRSVIVDMGEQVHAQVDDLVAATQSSRQEELIRGILSIGEAALPVLAQAFPGPLTWTREQGGRVPRAADLSPIARALAAFGARAAPYVAGLLSSGHPDVRLYAAIVASDMVSAELMDAVAERLHDEDVGVRRIAVQLLPRFAGFRGFEEIRTVLRRTARIRGRDLTRRWQAIDALAALRDVEMIPKLIELLRDEDEDLTKHVHEALVSLTATDQGTSHKRWAAWHERNRSRHRVEWLIDGLLEADEPIRHAAGEELKRLTQQYYGYHAGSPKRDREHVAKKYRDWWDQEGQRRFG